SENYRTQFAWHGYWPSKEVSYNNIGGPIWYPGSLYAQPGDTVGRLGAAQFVGLLTLHADQSPANHNDNVSQPSTTTYVHSDDAMFSGNDPFNVTSMTTEYNLMSSGHKSPRHAWVVQPNGNFALQTNPPEMGTSGGYSTGNGYGPYTLAPGESINLVLVEGAAGLSREECIRIGKEYKHGTINDLTKNNLVLTGKDSLMKTWKMATENYQSNYNLPALPLPPKEVHITSQNTSINLTWQLFENSSPSNSYRIYRRYVKADSTFRMIYEGPSSVLSYEDNNLRLGAQYSYYIVAVDGNGLTSNPAYTYSAVTVSTLTSVKSESETIKDYSLTQNYPNPFNPETIIRYALPSGSNVKLTVYNSLGQKVKELVNGYQESNTYEVKFSSRELASGMYIYKLDAVSKDGKKNFSSSRKMLLVK
ncbi:MAG: T9SS type A sorting domain-containing protein, partial [Bacteroidota bacterium]|nr:T9SS type A sorting domain-containing protein [Bacteroidota bacterium]